MESFRRNSSFYFPFSYFALILIFLNSSIGKDVAIEIKSENIILTSAYQCRPDLEQPTNYQSLS